MTLHIGKELDLITDDWRMLVITCLVLKVEMWKGGGGGGKKNLKKKRLGPFFFFFFRKIKKEGVVGVCLGFFFPIF